MPVNMETCNVNNTKYSTSKDLLYLEDGGWGVGGGHVLGGEGRAVIVERGVEKCGGREGKSVGGVRGEWLACRRHPYMFEIICKECV